jgi:hypothetical protein
MKPQRIARQRGHWGWVVDCLIVAGVILVIALVVDTGEVTLTDMNGDLVIADDDSRTPDDQAIDMVLHQRSGEFQIPSVGLSADLGSINDVDGVMYPPNYESVFHVRNRGVGLTNAEEGTVFLVTHATAGGRSPGNYVQVDQNVTLNAGEFIIIGDLTYLVVDTYTVPKTEIGEDARLWESTPGRLVFMTCLVEPSDGPSTTNIVIIGDLVT